MQMISIASPGGIRGDDGRGGWVESIWAPSKSDPNGKLGLIIIIIIYCTPDNAEITYKFNRVNYNSEQYLGLGGLLSLSRKKIGRRSFDSCISVITCQCTRFRKWKVQFCLSWAVLADFGFSVRFSVHFRCNFRCNFRFSVQTEHRKTENRRFSVHRQYFSWGRDIVFVDISNKQFNYLIIFKTINNLTN